MRKLRLVTCSFSNPGPCGLFFGFLLSQAPQEHRRHSRVGLQSPVGGAHMDGVAGWQASSGGSGAGWKRLEVCCGTGMGGRPPPRLRLVTRLCSSSWLCCTWWGGLDTARVALHKRPSCPRASHALLTGACAYVLRFISLLPNNSPFLVVRWKEISWDFRGSKS